MSTFGSGDYSKGLYGGADAPNFTSTIPCVVTVYDNLGTFKQIYQSGVGDFIGCDFSINESGSRDFELFFAKSQDIDKKDIAKIQIFNSEDIFFTGVVRKTPIDGSTSEDYNYSGYGFTDYLERINAESQSFANKTILDILDTLLNDIITVKTPISYNQIKVNPPNITIVSFDLNYPQMNDVLDALLDLANSEGDYIYGVDEEGDFFFKERSSEIKATLVVGKTGDYGIDEYKPEDEFEARTKYFVLDKDGGYVTTISSAENNDIYEEKITAPDLDNASIITWAEGKLAKNETNTRRASIVWKIEPYQPVKLIGDGYLRIISNIPAPSQAAPNPNPFGTGVFGSGLFGGGQYNGKDIDDTLAVKEVSYTLNGSESIRTIQLGAVPVQLEDNIININKDLQELRISLGR